MGSNSTWEAAALVSKLRARLTYANVMATVAVFIALGGTSYGIATGSIDSREIKNDTVRSKDIRNNQVRSKDVRNFSLLSRDFAPGQLPAGPRGATGPVGPQGPSGATNVVVRSNSATVNPNSSLTITNRFVPCASGERATGGGAIILNDSGVPTNTGDDRLLGSAPANAAGGAPSEGETPSGWLVGILADDAGANTRTVRFYAVCARP